MITTVLVRCADGTGDCRADCPDGVWTAIWRGPAGPEAGPGRAGWYLASWHCGTPGAADNAPTLTLQEFQRLPLPAGAWTVQPPGGRVLVGMPTNVFVTDTAVVEMATTIVGQRVQVRATPVLWTWDFGDGAVFSSTDPGARYPDLTNAHTYTARGSYAITLTTSYRGDYLVEGGRWVPVDGRAQVTGPATTVQAVAGRPQLVAGTS